MSQKPLIWKRGDDEKKYSSKKKKGAADSGGFRSPKIVCRGGSVHKNRGFVKRKLSEIFSGDIKFCPRRTEGRIHDADRNGAKNKTFKCNRKEGS